MSRTPFDGDVWASAVKGDTGEVVRPASNELDDGWLTVTYPNRKYDNWAKLALFEACQWIEEKGTFDWDSTITYAIGALVKYSSVTYISILGTNLNQQPDTATTYWENYYDWLTSSAGKTLTVANEAALGTGVTDGQLRGTAAGNLYTWNDGDTKWDGRDGNDYATTPAFGNVQFNNGTLATINDITFRYNGTTWEEIGAVTVGRLDRPEFVSNASSTQIDLKGPAGYHLDGKGWVWWTGTLAYDFTTLASTVWSYLYLDESAITGPGKITASELIDSTTAPAYDSTKGGWYNGSDKCIFAVYGTGASSYTTFKNRNDLVTYEERIIDLASTAVVVSPGTSYSLTAPAFCRQSLVTLAGFYTSASAAIFQREAGSTLNGHLALRLTSGTAERSIIQQVVDISSSQQVNLYADVAGSNAAISTDGFFLPKGM